MSADILAITLAPHYADRRASLAVASDGHVLYDAAGLRSGRLCDWVREVGRYRLVVGFGLTWQVDHLLCDLPRAALCDLARDGNARWSGLEIIWLDGHMLALTESGHPRGGLRWYDLAAYFGPGQTLTEVCRSAGIGVPQVVAEEESVFSESPTWTDRYLQAYWEAWNLMACDLAELMRSRLSLLSLPRGGLRGLGTLGEQVLARAGAKAAIAEHPELSPDIPSRLFHGGRLEASGWGRLKGDLESCDISSAYGWAMSQLPSLRGWKWEEAALPACEMEVEPWGIYEASWSGESIWGWHPLPLRAGDQTVFPCEARGWYFGVELATAYGFAGTVTVHRALLPQGPGPHYLGPGPLAETTEAFIERRRHYASLGRGHDLSIWLTKSAVNAAWGVMCRRDQRTEGEGKRRRRDPYRSLLWAAMTTALIRARVNRAILASPERVYAVIVDSIICRPGTVALGDQPGDWRRTAASKRGGVIISEGISQVGKDVRRRGFRATELRSPERIRAAFERIAGDRRALDLPPDQKAPSDWRWAWYIPSSHYISLALAAQQNLWDQWRTVVTSTRSGLIAGNILGQHWPDPHLRHPSGGFRRAQIAWWSLGARPDPPGHDEGPLWHPLFAVPQTDESAASATISSQPRI